MPRAGGDVGLERRERQKRGLGPPLGQLGHRLCQILVALHHIQVQRIARCRLAIPRLHAVRIAQMQVDAAEQRVHIRQETRLPLLRIAVAQRADRAPRICRLASGKLTARKQSHHGKFHIRRSAAPDIADAGHEREHTGRDILSLFKLALGDGTVGKAHAVASQHRFHRYAQRAVEQVVALAPIGEILAAVHNARQRARHGKGRQCHLFIEQQAKHRLKRIDHPRRAPLRQRNIQPCKPAARLTAGGVPSPAARGKGPERLVPLLRPLVVHRQRAEHTHALHQ